MPTIEDFSFVIHPLWEKEWSEAFAEAQGGTKQLIALQSRLANMLKCINNVTVNAERLAWFGLWTKTFAILDGARAALARNSQYVLQMLSRVTFESMLHIRTICEPVSKLYELKSATFKTQISEQAEQRAWNDAIERMRAYTAWCLWNDRQFYQELIDERTLNDVWNPNPARDIANDPEKLAIHEALFGPLDVEINSTQLKKGRSKQERQLRLNLNRVEAWLNHSDIQSWFTKLNELKESPQYKTSFFALFNETEESISKRLQSFELRFAYASYMQGSMIIHGSTLDQLFHIGDDKFVPLFFGINGQAEALAVDVGKGCNQIMILLFFLQQHLWNDKG
jgi:hypothetical protein